MPNAPPLSGARARRITRQPDLYRDRESQPHRGPDSAVIPLRDELPVRGTPYGNYTLIGLCVLAFLWQLSLGEAGGQRIVYALGMIPSVLLRDTELPPEIGAVPALLTLLTSMFLHGGFMHLAGNMLYLWIFGDNIEEAMGHGNYLLFYVICGGVAALSQAYPDPNSLIPMIGASGAISGVLGAYLMLFPHTRILTLVPLGFFTRLMHVKAVWVLLLWFAIQLVSNLAGRGGGVAFSAHIGGFVAGVVLVGLFKQRSVPFGFSRR